ncbi:hypothetical protein I302_101945 [Kwoniella bestiolae CBS 10118]|uniref:Uncharacterized protein n=1 Tax=Kwoniella bestiolae CBS 10118 TaxID=1296100 RepID=A0AAJ8K393_9TREE
MEEQPQPPTMAGPTTTATPPNHYYSPSLKFTDQFYSHKLPPLESTTTFTNRYATPNPEDIKRTLNCYTTLHLSSSSFAGNSLISHPLDELFCYITIPESHGQPEWESKNILWADGSAEKLIRGYQQKGTTSRNFNRPVPVFKSVSFGVYGFIGWWKYTSLRIIEPQTKELMDMMRMKEEAGGYEECGKSEKKWKKAISRRWVKLGFVQVRDKFLKGISEMEHGEGGEYVLKVGRLNEEVKVLREYESGGWKVENGSR